MNEFHTEANTSNVHPVCLEAMRQLLQSLPPVLVEIRVHPDWMDVFMANLREEGFIKTGRRGLLEVPIVADTDIPYGEWRPSYQHVFRAPMEDDTQ